MKKTAHIKKSPLVTPFTIVGIIVLGLLLVVLYYAATRPTTLESKAALSCPDRCSQKICANIKEDKKPACIDTCEEILCNFLKTCDQKCESNVTCNKKTGTAKTDCISQCKKNKCGQSYKEVKDIRACESRCETKTCKETTEENKTACISRCKRNCRE